MSAPIVAGEQSQINETPQPAADAPAQVAQAAPQEDGQAAQAPLQAEGDIAIDDNNSAYSDDLSVNL